MIIPVVRSNTNLSAAFAVAVHAQGTIGAPLILPVDLLAGVGGGFGAATVVFTIPLTGSSGEDPGVSHGQHGGKGGDDGDGIFHCGGSFERLDVRKVDIRLLWMVPCLRFLKKMKIDGCHRRQWI